MITTVVILMGGPGCWALRDAIWASAGYAWRGRRASGPGGLCVSVGKGSSSRGGVREPAGRRRRLGTARPGPRGGVERRGGARAHLTRNCLPRLPLPWHSSRSRRQVVPMSAAVSGTTQDSTSPGGLTRRLGPAPRTASLRSAGTLIALSACPPYHPRTQGPRARRV